MLLIYNLIFPILFLLYLPYYLLHIYRRGGLTADYWQRFGFFGSPCKTRLRALRQPVWIHAVSVGETVAAITFIKAWLKRHPQEEMVFSCGTATGFATAAQKLPPQVVRIYCPIDLFWATRQALRLIRPRMLVIFEVEIWPNLVLQAARRGCRVVLVNGRMSDRSSHGYARWKFLFRPIFQAFSCLCVQTPEDASRLERVMGADERIKVCGTMKFDQVPDAPSSAKDSELERCFGPGPRVLLVAGSTHPGEEALICDCFQTLKKDLPELRLMLVPRHQERAAEVEELLRIRGLTWQLLRPISGQQATSPSPAEVLLVNTTGELMNFYAAGDIAYVGKSLAGQSGGHNMIEPAIFGKAIIYGPEVQNFRAVAALFREEQASIELADESEMLPQLRRLLAEPEARAKLGRRARELVDKYRGCIEQTLDCLAAL